MMEFMESRSVRAVFFAVGGFVAGVALTSSSSNFFPRESTRTITLTSKPRPAALVATSTAPTLAHTDARIQVENQVASTSVQVAQATLSTSSWLVVHEITDGHVGNALGAARRDPGTHTAITIELLRSTETARPYMLVLYQDNGNKEFDLRGDIPIVDKNGDPVIQRFETL